jgi:hypothetical protein
MAQTGRRAVALESLNRLGSLKNFADAVLQQIFAKRPGIFTGGLDRRDMKMQVDFAIYLRGLSAYQPCAL